MDGNGRWALRRGKRRVAGHQAGAVRVRGITTESAKLGIEQLTLYALSVENYHSRPKGEISALMRLFRRYLVDERPTLMENEIRFRAIGRLDELPGNVLTELRKTEETTAKNLGMTLCVAVNYGGRSEISDAARSVARKTGAGGVRPEDVDEDLFGTYLYTAGMPDVDLVVRTAGEMRVSNFLLWQSWYAELYVTEVLWPDFDEGELHKAVREYARRERKFGRVRPPRKRRGT